MNTAQGKIQDRFLLSRCAAQMIWIAPAMLIAFLLALPCCAQMQQMQMPNGSGTGRGQSSQPTMRGTQPPDFDVPMGSETGDTVYQERRLRLLNLAQHKSMVSDTDKLLKLVTELNSEIDGKDPSSLTPQQLRKIAEIEKLAHSVKDKMRMSVKGAANRMNNSSPIPPFAPE